MALIGVSMDDLASHRMFASQHGLTFPLLADTAGRLAAAFGVDTTGGYARRVTFIVDRQGRIARVFPTVRPQGHAAEVLATIRALSSPRP